MIGVVVTGIGAVTPLGVTAIDTWQQLLAGASGIAPYSFDDEPGAGLAPFVAGSMAIDPGQLLSRVEARRLDRSQQAALASARQAWAHAAISHVDPERLAVVIGSGIGGVSTLLREDDVLETSGPRRVSPRTVPQLMANGATAAVSIDLGAEGGAYTPVSACSSGAEAIAQGARLILAGEADVVVAGGTEAPIAPITVAAFQQTRALAHPADPAEASARAFAADRSGFVLAEGAAIVVLESASHAQRRGANLLAELAGWGVRSDAHHMTAPRPDGAGQIQAMRAALRQAGLNPADVDHVNAHATGTLVGDASEARAINAVFGRIPATAPKASLGHLFGAAGAVEAIIALLSVHHRLTPPTRNLDTTPQDPDIDLDVVTTPRETSKDAVLSNSFGFGGQNVSLVFTPAH